jgi:predicted metal-dependent hydrolase
MFGLFRRADPPTATLPDLIIAGRHVPVVLVRNPRARRLTLRADPIAGEVRVTLPSRAKVGEAAALIAAQRDWLAPRVARWPRALPFAAGATIPYDGEPLLLDWSAAHPRGVHRDGGVLRIGGPRETLPGRTLRWLRAEALTAMTEATHETAARIDRRVTRVSVRDAAGRWGSCAPTGAINYSWRLILAPGWVRHAVVAHEVAHLVHHNHGADFWALARELTGADTARSRRWLAAHGAGLHWVGRSAA